MRSTFFALLLGLLTALPVQAMTIPWPDFSDIMGTDDSGTQTIDNIIQYTTPTIDTISPSGVITAPTPTVTPTPIIPIDVLSGVNLDLLTPVVNANINLNANANSNVNVPVRIPWPTGMPTPSPTAAGETTGDDAEAVGPESPAGSAEAVGPESPAGSGWLAAAAAMTDPAQLSGFAQSLADADPNVKGISVDGAVLRFSYRQPAKLLGIIPLHYTITVQYDIRDSQTTFMTPWWLGLASDNVDVIKAAVSSQLAQLKAVQTANTLEYMAHIIAVLESIMHKTGTAVGAVVVNVK